MIKITFRPDEPAILKKNATIWQTELGIAKTTKDNALIAAGNNKKDGTYLKAEKEYDNIVSKYNHDDVKNALYAMPNGKKCVYCGSILTIRAVIYKDIEHWIPKSLDYTKCFDWKNLFLCCKSCNTTKSDYDTRTLPFLHPENHNPEDFMAYEMVTGKPFAVSNEPNTIATIEKCGLDKADITNLYQKEIHNFEISIEHHIESILSGDIHILHSKMLYYRKFGDSNAKFTGLLRFLFRNSAIMNAAKDFINAHQKDLGLTTPFEWVW